MTLTQPILQINSFKLKKKWLSDLMSLRSIIGQDCLILLKARDKIEPGKSKFNFTQQNSEPIEFFLKNADIPFGNSPSIVTM